MADLTSVGVTSGVPSSGTGTVATINQLIAVGAPISNGSTSAPVTVAITQNASAVTSSMNALVVSLSPNSSVRNVTLSSNPTVIPSSVATVTLSSNPTVILSSNPTVILSSNPTITSVSSGATTIIFGSNVAVVTGDSSLPTSSMPALLVAMSPNGINANGQQTKANSAPVTLASDQTFTAGGMPVTISSSVNLANVVAGSSAVTSTMAALVVALSTLGGGISGGSSTVGLSSAIALSSGTVTLSSARNFLWQVGAASSGLLVTAVTIMSTEFVSLASTTAVVGANTYGSSNTGQAIWCDVYATFGTSATTTAGSAMSGWFCNSLDGGTTFESTANVGSGQGLARPPDFVIPTPVATLGSSLTYKSNGLVRLPAGQWKPILMNNLGVVTASSSNAGYPLLRIAPYAEQY